jgi:hypothetical protein
LSDENFSNVLSQAMGLSPEDQLRLIKCLTQSLETTDHDSLEKSLNETHSAAAQTSGREKVTASYEGEQLHWNFTVEDDLYGKLICSYHLEENLLNSLDEFFAYAVEEQKGNRTVVNINHAIMCREEALKRLREKIEHNIQDAMEGLIYEVRLEVLRSFNSWYFFINFNFTEQLQELRKFYIDCVNHRMKAHQGGGQGREAFLIKIISAYAKAAEKANKKVAIAAKGKKNASPGRYGIRLEERRAFDWKREFYGKVTKASLARELELAGYHISQSVLSRQMKRYKIKISDLDKSYDEKRRERERR